MTKIGDVHIGMNPDGSFDIPLRNKQGAIVDCMSVPGLMEGAIVASCLRKAIRAALLEWEREVKHGLSEEEKNGLLKGLDSPVPEGEEQPWTE